MSSPEDELRERLGDHDFLIDLFQMGEQMRAFVSTPVGKFLCKELRDDFNDALSKLLLDEGDTARHVTAMRVAWSALGRIDSSLRAGAAAEQMISDDEVSRHG